jgi:hypothetical protein
VNPAPAQLTQVGLATVTKPSRRMGKSRRCSNISFSTDNRPYAILLSRCCSKAGNGPVRKESPVFEEIEKANDGREMILAPQNHPDAFLSFVWDTSSSRLVAPPRLTLLRHVLVA